MSLAMNVQSVVYHYVTPCFEMYHTYLDYENAYIVWQRSKNVDDILSNSMDNET